MASPVNGVDEPNCTLWLATRAGKMELSCPIGTTRLVPREKFPRKPNNKSVIDQAFSVKMAGYCPHSFFASLWTSTPSQSINPQKKNLADIKPSWPHTWSITHTYLLVLKAADATSKCSNQKVIFITLPEKDATLMFCLSIAVVCPFLSFMVTRG